MSCLFASLLGLLRRASGGGELASSHGLTAVLSAMVGAGSTGAGRGRPTPAVLHRGETNDGTADGT